MSTEKGYMKSSLSPSFIVHTLLKLNQYLGYILDYMYLKNHGISFINKQIIFVDLFHIISPFFISNQNKSLSAI